MAKHSDGSINDNSLNYECFKKWHWEWSKYYFLNKHYNKIIILIIALKNFLKLSIKAIFLYFMNKKIQDLSISNKWTAKFLFKEKL